MNNLAEQEQKYTLQTLRIIEKNSSFTQRDLSTYLSISLGKINYLINSLIEKGLIKAERFRNSKKKRAYLYLLTPKGMQHKITLTKFFLKTKIKEYDSLQLEIENLKKELENNT